ncbi:MAG: glycosyl hydrolase 2 galactose-binding domain-containing protein, partial [Candidatus Hodarchaeales archaeon]
MPNELVLDNWSYSVMDQTKKSEIVDKIKNHISPNSFNIDFNLFEVPGTLQSNIVRLLDIDPYFEQNMKQLSIYETSTLLLSHEINLEGEIQSDYQLLIERIDSMADIYLNGQLLAKTSNAFLQQNILISRHFLKQGQNSLFIVISPAISFVPETSDLPETRDRVFVRRPTYNFGWDFAPRAVLCGIGQTKFSKTEEILIKDLFVITEKISEDYAELLIRWTIESQSNKNSFFSFELKIFGGDDNIVFISELTEIQSPRNENFQTKINLENPMLWWPSGLGSQHLYRLEIVEKKSENKFETKFGIRTINLLLKENNQNTFIFEINGKKIWAKGANWVPTDALTNFSDSPKYKELLSLAKDANFNMLRIWGGGVVEANEFYDLCDELGLM